MQPLTQWLYVISTALLAPVIVALLVLLGWMLVLLGGFLRELLARRGARGQIEAALAAARGGVAARPRVWASLESASSGLALLLCRKTAGRRETRAEVSMALVDLENDVAHALAPLSFCTRVAPMLGLMATLIPLGPALMALARGNVSEMAQNLVVAFTATVAGLLVSGVTYGMGLVRRTWYARDMSDLEFLSERLVAEAA